MIRKVVMSFLAAAAPIGLALSVETAMGHASLVNSTPLASSVVRHAPREIRLTFSEAIEPAFSSVELVDAGGAILAAASRGSRRSNQIVLRVPPLPPGRYGVKWRVISVDTHRTRGDFVFEVRP
jgi:methionine-rich copper-binding protein CopC